MYTKIIWFTGLSGSGKTTLANKFNGIIHENNKSSMVIDGDSFRKEYSKDLKFTASDIENNNLRIINYVLKMIGNFDFILVSAITPFEKIRNLAKKKLNTDISLLKFVFVRASLDCVINRDVKGIYEKARQNNDTHVIGINPLAQYEEPVQPDIVVDTEFYSINESVALLSELI